VFRPFFEEETEEICKKQGCRVSGRLCETTTSGKTKRKDSRAGGQGGGEGLRSAVNYRLKKFPGFFITRRKGGGKTIEEFGRITERSCARPKRLARRARLRHGKRIASRDAHILAFSTMVGGRKEIRSPRARGPIIETHP